MHPTRTAFLCRLASGLRPAIGAAILLFGGAAQAQPTVTVLTPARNALSVPRTTPVAVSFNQPLSTMPATQQALRVFSQQAGGQKSGTATVSGNTLSFQPATAFKPGEMVSATLTTGVQSSGGQALAQPQVFQFTTATAPSAGTFNGGSDIAGQGSGNLAAADVDGDGDLDVAYTAGSTVSIRLNNGTGGFSGNQVIPVSSPKSAAFGDMDNDGDLDLVVTTLLANAAVVVWLNDGSGTFSGGTTIVSLNSLNDVALGDIDGDGDLDIVAGGQAGFIAIIRNLNAGTVFSDGRATIIQANGEVHKLKLVDVNNDGDLDIVAACWTFGRIILAGSVYVGQNDGTGSFEITQAISVMPGSVGLDVGDLDGDGDLDLMTIHLLYATTTLLLNNGSGSFSSGVGIPLPEAARSVCFGDVDGDGDLDVLVSNTDSRIGLISEYLNNGPATFYLGQQVVVGVRPEGIVLRDVDGNGILDLLTANGDTKTISVRLNEPLPPSSAVRRFNAGGGGLNASQGVFAADQYFSASSATLTTTAPIAGTDDDALYQSERYSTDGQLRYAVPMANGTYDVVLHFAETYWTQPGQRVFNIGLEGSTVHTNYDIVAKVGPLTATTEIFQVTVTDGVLNLDLTVPYLSGGRDQAKLSALEIVPISTTRRLKAGGPALSTSQGVFAADQYFSASSATLTTTAPIAGTDDDALYQSERYSTDGQLRYTVPVMNGEYVVILHFAELYWTQRGQRVFNIGLEGRTVRTNYDIVAKVGPLTATTEVFSVQVTDGVLNLDLLVPYLSGGRDQAKLSALEIVPVIAAQRVNAGGPALATSRGMFAADQYFSAGSAIDTTTAAIAGTDDDALYQDARYSNGILRYAVPVANGQYVVVLHFAELFWTTSDSRVFTIRLEGRPVRTNYDIFAKAGFLTATTETAQVNIVDGELNIDLDVPALTGGRGNPTISALEVLQVGSAEPTSTRLVASYQPTVAGAVRARPVAALELYPNPSHGSFTLALVSAKSQAGTLVLTDRLGRVIREQRVTLQTGRNQLQLQYPNVREGLYQLTLRTADGQRLHQVADIRR